MRKVLFAALILLTSCSDPLGYDLPPPLDQSKTLSAKVIVANNDDFAQLYASCANRKIFPEDRVIAFYCPMSKEVVVRVSECSKVGDMRYDVFCHEFAHVGGWRHKGIQ